LLEKDLVGGQTRDIGVIPGGTVATTVSVPVAITETVPKCFT